MNEKPSYYAIITAEVRYCKDLSPNQKLLYGEITCLANKTGACFASNEYFADLYGVSKRAISMWVSALTEHGFIDRRMTYKEGTKEVEKRFLTLRTNLPDPSSINLPHPHEEMCADNNTRVNSTRVNKTPVVPTSYKGWTLDDFKEDVAKANHDGLLTSNECIDFIEYWTEPTPSGKFRLTLEKSWSTRRRMQTALRLIYTPNRGHNESSKRNSQRPIEKSEPIDTSGAWLYE